MFAEDFESGFSRAEKRLMDLAAHVMFRLTWIQTCHDKNASYFRERTGTATHDGMSNIL